MSVHPNDATEFQRELTSVKSDIAVVKVNVEHMADDIREIKENQREFNHYMLATKGARAWAVGFLSIAVALGAVGSHIVNIFFNR
jgi:hypothetical protein